METLTSIFVAVSIQFQLPAHLLESVCYVESRHRIDVVHYADGSGNSIGICQIKLKTARWLGFRGTEKELMDPEVNIYYAGKYLAWQKKRYKGSIPKSLIAYNIGNAKQLTTSAYYIKVMKQWREYASE